MSRWSGPPVAVVVKPEPLEIRIPDATLRDLRQRLERIRWAPEIDNDDWRYGASGAYLRQLVAYWLDGYDWRAREREIAAHEHARVEIEGVPIHFMRVPGRGPRPLPLVLSHGWPWTFWDFHRVLGPLSDPGAHGGDPADAFELVVPSLPGFGFSTPLERSGINWWRTADLWLALMRDALGHGRFFAHGGDWGALVTMQLGHRHPEHVRGIHLTNAFPMESFSGDRPWAIGDAAAAVSDAATRAEVLAFERRFASHIAVHMLDPQSLAFALQDSPLGLLAWIVERRRAWSDCGGNVERRFSRDHLLTTIMLYWATDSVSSSLRYYYEAAAHPWSPDRDPLPRVGVPTGISLFRGDMAPGPSDWTAEYYHRVYLKIHESGGHFAAAEEPEAVVNDIRATFRPLRGEL